MRRIPLAALLCCIACFPAIRERTIDARVRMSGADADWILAQHDSMIEGSMPRHFDSVRTRIDLHTRQAWFVLERLEPMPVSAAIEAAAMLTQLMRAMTPTATFATQVMDRTGTAKIT